MARNEGLGLTLVFGAGGRLGGAVARQLNYLATGTRLRLDSASTQPHVQAWE